MEMAKLAVKWNMKTTAEDGKDHDFLLFFLTEKSRMCMKTLWLELSRAKVQKKLFYYFIAEKQGYYFRRSANHGKYVRTI